jgi:hypothetical protein
MEKSKKKQQKELEKKALELEKKLAEKLAEQEKQREKLYAEAQQNASESARPENGEQTAEDIHAEDEVKAAKDEADELDDEDMVHFPDEDAASVKPEDIKTYCDFAEEVKQTLDKHILRAAGTNAEKRAAKAIRELIAENLGANARMEPFYARRLRGRASIVVLGFWLALCFLFHLLSFSTVGAGGAVFSAVNLVLLLLGAVVFLSLIVGFPHFKPLYPKAVSYNVVAELKRKSPAEAEEIFVVGKVEAQEGEEIEQTESPQSEFENDETVREIKTRKTVVLTCAYDSPLGNNFKLKKHIMPVIMLCAVMTIPLFAALLIAKIAVMPSTAGEIAGILVPSIILIVPAILALCGFISLYKSKTADTNSLNVAAALAAAKYFADANAMPEDIKFVFLAAGAGYAGHGGAEEYIKRHKAGLLSGNPLVINLGEIIDDKLTVVSRDFFMAQKNDDGLVGTCIDAAVENNLAIDNYSGFLNSYYGFASTPFEKAGIPAVTLMSKDMGINPLKESRKETASREALENCFVTVVAVLEKITRR